MLPRFKDEPFVFVRAVLFLATPQDVVRCGEECWLLEDEPVGDCGKRCFADLRHPFPTPEASTPLNNVKEDDHVRETARKDIAVLRGGRTRTFQPASVRDEFTCGVAGGDRM